ncbi:MAG: permease-like cell division protein FtsX [Nitriliruptoraceae bacterium]
MRWIHRAVVLTTALTLAVAGCAPRQVVSDPEPRWEATESDPLNELLPLLNDMSTPDSDLSVFLCTGHFCTAMTDEQRQQLISELQATAGVIEVVFESRDDLYKQFGEMVRERPDLVEAVSPEQFPDVLRVTLDVRGDPGHFADRFTTYPGVDEVQIHPRSPAGDEQPNEATVGDAIRLGGSTTTIVVTIIEIIDPADPGRRALDEGRRVVAIDLLIENLGPETYDRRADWQATLIDTDHRQHSSTARPRSTSCHGFDGSVTLTAGDLRRGCIFHEISSNAGLRSYQFAHGRRIGTWDLTDQP